MKFKDASSLAAAMRAIVLVILLLMSASFANGQAASFVPLPDLTHEDHWDYATTLSAPGSAPTQATARASVVSVESVTVAGTAYDAYRVEMVHGGARAGESNTHWYRTSDFAKLKVESASAGSTTTFTFDAPCEEWRFPLTSGKAYGSDCTVRVGSAAPFRIMSDWNVSEPVSVSVPAGTFQAFLLEQQGEGFTERWWWARETCFWLKHESIDGSGAVTSSEAMTAIQCTPVALQSPSPTPATATPMATPSPTVTAAATTPTGVVTGTPPPAPVVTPTATPTTGPAAAPQESPMPPAIAILVAVAAAALVLRRKAS